MISESKEQLTVAFRPCQAADLPAVQSLVDDLYISDPNTQDVRPDIKPTFDELTQRPEKGRLLVIERESRIVGYCIIIFFWSNEYGGNIIDVDELCLVADQRGQGIGAKLFDWIAETFPEKLVGFCFQVAHHNDPMLKLAHRMGFSVARNQHFIKVFAEYDNIKREDARAT